MRGGFTQAAVCIAALFEQPNGVASSALLNLRSNEVIPATFFSVGSVPAFATMLSMPRFSDAMVSG